VIREPTMNPNPASSTALRVAAESIPASATATMSRTPWRCANATSPRPARSGGGGTPAGRRRRRPQRQLWYAGPVRDLVHPRRDHLWVPELGHQR
jgi:hypothetical protein